MKIWVAYRDFYCEGKSEPLAAFSSERDRDMYLAGFAAADSGTMLVKEFDVPGPADAP